jgi:hypothetical protein
MGRGGDSVNEDGGEPLSVEGPVLRGTISLGRLLACERRETIPDMVETVGVAL